MANQVGLNLSERLKDALEIVRAKVDIGLTWVIDKVVTIVERLVDMGRNAVNAIVNWWQTRKEISEDGETHTIYFNGQDASAQLMIASTPTPYNDYIDSINISPTDPKKDEKIAAKVTAKSKYNELAALKAKTPPDPNDGTLIIALMGEIATATKTVLFPRKTVPPSAPPIYGGVSGGGFGTRMQATLLTSKVPEGGSRADSSLPGPKYDSLNKRYEKAHSVKPFYLRGHLLNGELGGPGNNWENLTPLTTQSNKIHFNQAEKKIKDYLLTDKDKDKHRVNYTVTVEYGGWDNTSALIASLNDPDQWDSSDTTRAILREILAAEEFVPRRIKCVANAIDENGAETVLVNENPAIENDIRRDAELSKYYVTD